MDIVPSEWSKGPPSTWFDVSTVKNVQCIISNIFLEMNPIFAAYTGFANAPLRIWNCAVAFQDRAYWKVALDVLAFSALFFPMGRQAAIAIDLVSELVSIYRKTPNRNSDQLDCTIRANALKVLGLSEEDAANQEKLTIRYTELCAEWDKRIAGAKCSPPLLTRFQILRAQVEEAYQTLSGGKQN